MGFKFPKVPDIDSPLRWVFNPGSMNLDRILKGTSRSFFLTLRVAPRRLRRQLGVAYLFCRAADTIADTALLPAERRKDLLRHYRFQFQMEKPDLAALDTLAEELTSARSIPEERVLLSSLGRCFEAFLGFGEVDRALIRRLVTTLTLGMEMDLESFPLTGGPTAEKESAGGLEFPAPQALPGDSELDRYCYHVAGCVGEFWTDIAAAHLPVLKGWDLEAMRAKGVRFGKGLQMTNVIRDFPQDLRQGRCYIPASRLESAGVSLGELRGGGRSGNGLTRALIPILDDLLDLTLSHYTAGWEYTLSIPGRAPRLRLACAWPLLIGLETLALLRQEKDLLLQGHTLVIPQGSVWRILATTAPVAFSDRLLDRIYRRLERGAKRK